MNNRLQKKCFIAAAGLHLLLVVILFVGPAFLSSEKPEKVPPLVFTPSMTIEKLLAGGGNPNPRPPAAQTQTQPQTQPQPRVQESTPPPQPQPQSQVQTDPPKPVQRDPDALTTKKPAKKLPDVVLTPVTRPKPGATKKPQPTKNPDTKAESSDTTESRLASAARNAASSLRGGLSSSTSIKISDAPDGPGGGGPSYASYKQVLQRVYFEAWIEPDDQSVESATVVASVTIARSGSVISSRILKSSSNASLDRSVQATLNRVTFVAPFPAESKEDQHTFTINFNASAKRGTG